MSEEKKTYVAPPPMMMPGSDKPIGENSGFGLGTASSPYSPAGYKDAEEEGKKEE